MTWLVVALHDRTCSRCQRAIPKGAAAAQDYDKPSRTFSHRCPVCAPYELREGPSVALNLDRGTA